MRGGCEGADSAARACLISAMALSESGFTGLSDFQDSSGASLTGGRLSVFVLAGFAVIAKLQFGRSEIPKIPPILKILILTKPRNRAPRPMRCLAERRKARRAPWMPLERGSFRNFLYSAFGVASSRFRCYYDSVGSGGAFVWRLSDGGILLFLPPVPTREVDGREGQ